jgi:hypothetical protein
MDADADRRARAEARKKRAILRKTTLSEREHDLSPITGAEAVSLVDRLTRESWSLAGLPEPTYTRSEIPIRFVPRRSES